ncbi:phytoene desaturase [Candidatus Saccharibacteria bacterium]|nr:phytoene desaturase [Candidatus Saccharibacteria bacterium]
MTRGEVRSVAIIGAGIGGLATAALLAKAGFSVDIYEQGKTPGGRAGLLEANGFRFDTGPSWYLMPGVFEHFYELMGEDISHHLRLRKLSPAYTVFFEHEQPVTITTDQARDEATFEAIEAGAGEALRRYVDQGEQTYRLALKHFLYSNFSTPRDVMNREVLRHGPAMARMAGTSIDRHVGGFVQDRRLRQILEYPMVFLGTSPFSAPAIYSLMSALDFREGVYYPEGGLYEIIRSITALAQKAGARLHYGKEATAITHTGNRAGGITFADGSQTAADIIISNADLHHTETRLLDRSAQSYPEKYWQNREAGPSALLLYLGIKGKLPQLSHHNLLFVDAWRQNFEAIYRDRTFPDPASIYLCKPSATDKTVAPKGHENVFVLVPLPPGRIPSDKEQHQLVTTYLRQIANMTGIPDLMERITYQSVFGPGDFSRVFHAWQSTALGPSHLLRQSAMFRTPNRSRKLSNLYYVGAGTTPGVGLPMCLIGAELIYKRLAGDHRGGPVDAIRQVGREGA